MTIAVRIDVHARDTPSKIEIPERIRGTYRSRFGNSDYMRRFWNEFSIGVIFILFLGCVVCVTKRKLYVCGSCLVWRLKISTKFNQVSTDFRAFHDFYPK